MAQQVKDPALSLQWLRSLLWHRFNPWPRNFHMPQVRHKKRKEDSNYYTLFFFFRATRAAYVSSQTGGRNWSCSCAYATATATRDPSRICDLHHSSWQCQILNLLRDARDQTWILMDTSWVHYCWATMGTPRHILNLLLEKTMKISKVIYSS